MAATEATYSFSSSSSAAGRRVSQRNSVASVGLKAKELGPSLSFFAISFFNSF
jgi:hypothetical protein